MIAEKYPPDEPTHFTLLLPDYHLEYPLDGHEHAQGMPSISLIWQPFNLQQRLEANGIHDSEEIIHDLATKLFPWPHFDHLAGVNVWQVHGTESAIGHLIAYLAQILMGGPAGGDDDTYDYWPGAFEMLAELVRDYVNITTSIYSADYYIGHLERVVTSAIACCGPLEDWEADGIADVGPGLRKLAKELAS